MLNAYEVSLKPAAEAFISSYDALRISATTRSSELKQGHRAARALLTRMLGWVAHIDAHKAIDGFDRSGFGDSPDVPDDVISDAATLVDMVKTVLEQDPESVSFAEALLGELEPLLQAARIEWSEAEAARSTHQLQVAENQRNATQFAELLIGFRRSLARVVGRNHPDFQRLRAAKIDRTALEAGEAEGLPSDLIPEATATTRDQGSDDDEEAALAS